jgi:catechol 2,3-dioxygenase-like lactoylglutathione lyase family enzyme
MRVVRIHHIAMRTGDLARLERFYVGVLGLSLLRRDDARGSVWLDAGGSIVMLEHADAGEPRPPPGSKDLVAFAIDDADDTGIWRERLRAAGVAIEAETPHTLYFRDPDERRVAVSAYR